MSDRDVTGAEILEAVHKVFTRAELAALSDRECNDFEFPLVKRLRKPGPPPTHDELLGIRELVTEWLSHPALDAHVRG